MDEVFEDLKEHLLQTMPVERRLEGIPTNDIVEYLIKLIRSQQLTAEELLAALDPEEQARPCGPTEHGEQAQ